MNTTKYPGIDYGLGRTNISASGIRFGVIPANDVGSAWFEDSKPDYGEPTCPKCGHAPIGEAGVYFDWQSDGVYVCESCNKPQYLHDLTHDACPDCGGEVTRAVFKSGPAHAEYGCIHCSHAFNSDDAFGDSPRAFTYEQDGYKARQSGDDCDIFILESPFFTYAQLCSPCAPGACYLRSPLETHNANNRAFCFGHDWFESGIAPYPVYSVATGELVNPAQ